MLTLLWRFEICQPTYGGGIYTYNNGEGNTYLYGVGTFWQLCTDHMHNLGQ